MLLTSFTQGDAYPLPVIITQKDKQITPQEATKVRMYLGGAVASYPDGELTYSAENVAWMFPLTQERSYKIGNGFIDFQVQVQIDNTITIGSKIESVSVNKSVLKQAWDGNADAYMAESGGDYVGGNTLANALAPIHAEVANQIIVITSGVSSVNGKTGDVELTAEDVGAISAASLRTISFSLRESSGGSTKTYYSRSGATWNEFAQNCAELEILWEGGTNLQDIARKFYTRNNNVFINASPLGHIYGFPLYVDTALSKYVKGTDLVTEGGLYFWESD